MRERPPLHTKIPKAYTPTREIATNAVWLLFVGFALRAALIAFRPVVWGGDSVLRLFDRHSIVSAHQQIQFYPTFDVYWGATWGTPVPETIVRAEINAYSLPQDRLVWSAMSKSTDPDSVRELISDVSQVAANRLANEGVIARTAMR